MNAMTKLGDTPTATVEGSKLRLIPSGQERLATILSMIDEAQVSLALLFYMFTDDPVGRQVRDALVRAAERGVAVRVLVDRFGCGSTKDEFLIPLKEAGGHFCIFHPRYGRRYLIRNHQKMVIADQKKALIGGANINQFYMDDAGEERWRDLWLSIEGPAVPALQKYYDDVHRWTTSGRQRIRDLMAMLNQHNECEGKLQWKFGGPMRRHNPWPASIVKDINDGKRLDIVAAYFSPSRAMRKRIRMLASRGKARIVTAAKSDNTATIAAARYTYRGLLHGGVEIYEYQAAKLHTKLYIVDDAVHIGSSNFDFRSIYLNLEVMLRVEDGAFADAMRAYVDGEIAASKRITASGYKRRSTLWRRFKWAASYILTTTMDYTVTRRLNFGLRGV
jgi:cardiolipin synthase